MSDRTPEGSRLPLILILVLGGAILFGAIAYAAMVMSGPMPGMGH